MNVRSVVSGLALSLMLPLTSARAGEVADTLFTHGAVYTMDGQRPTAQAVATRGKQIVCVGDDKDCDKWIGANTRVIDLKGRMLMPGFVEAHLHPVLGSVMTAGADLQFDSVESILAALKAWDQANPGARLIRGFGWRYNVFPATGPDKAMLDRLFPDRPVVLVAIDGHSLWVNSKALEIAGVRATTPDPVPGFSFYQRDPKTKEPTGWVVEGPAELIVTSKLLDESPETVLAATANQLKKFAAAGITAAFDAGMAVVPEEAGYAGYLQLEQQKRLPIRIVGSYYWNDASIKDPVAIVLDLRKKFQSELVQFKALKINVDGGDFQRTTAMIGSYADEPGYHGTFLIPPAQIKQAVIKAQANGLYTHAHALGDAAVRAYLDAVEAAQKAYPNSPSRHTAAHGVYLTDDEIRRLAKLGVTYQASAQWNTPDPSIEVSLKFIGKEAVFKEYGRINSVLKAGGRVALGTDWPAANYYSSYRPLDAIQVALTRKILPQYGKLQVMPILPPEDERISLEQALKANTLDAAYSMGMENRIGSIKVGKLADLVVLEKDLHELPLNQISTTKVQLTMMNGLMTYRAGI